MQIFSPTSAAVKPVLSGDILVRDQWVLPAQAGFHAFPEEFMREPGQAVGIVCQAGFAWRPSINGVEVYRQGFWWRNGMWMLATAMIAAWGASLMLLL